jgi:hypothetical protein
MSCTKPLLIEPFLIRCDIHIQVILEWHKLEENSLPTLNIDLNNKFLSVCPFFLEICQHTNITYLYYVCCMRFMHTLRSNNVFIKYKLSLSV